jgi:dTDP-glucose pyrophosphorylase
MARRYSSLRIAVTPPGGESLAVADCFRAGLDATAAVVVSGDNVVADDDVAEFVDAARTGGDRCLVAVAPAEDTHGLTLVRADRGRVVSLVEKPERGGPGLAKAGLYFLGPSAVRTALAGELPRDRFGEASMTELLMSLLGAGIAVHTHQLHYGFRDIGTVAGLSRAVLEPVDPDPGAVGSERGNG